MKPAIMFVVVLLPVLTGIGVSILPFKKRRFMELFIEGLVIFNSLLVFGLLMNPPESPIAIVKFTGDLTLSFRIDGMSIVF